MQRKSDNRRWLDGDRNNKVQSKIEFVMSILIKKEVDQKVKIMVYNLVTIPTILMQVKTGLSKRNMKAKGLRQK